MITKLYLILFSTFWLLFISSFIGTKIADKEEAKLIYSNVMIFSVVLGVILSLGVGKIVDEFNPQVILPLAFFFRMGAIIMFCFIHDPSSYYSYGVSVVLVTGTVFETLTTDSLLLRLADERIRGLIYSTGHSFGSLGILIFSLGGGILFDRYGPYMPFMLVGALDFLFAVLASLLACCGVVKNDIKERRL